MHKLDTFVIKLPGSCSGSDLLDHIIGELDSYGVFSEKLQLAEGVCLLRTNDGASTLDALTWHHISVVRWYKVTR